MGVMYGLVRRARLIMPLSKTPKNHLGENLNLNFRDPGTTKYLIPGFGIGENGRDPDPGIDIPSVQSTVYTVQCT